MRSLATLILFLLLPAASASASGSTVAVQLDKPLAGPVGQDVPVGASVLGSVDRVEFSVRGVVKYVDSAAPYGGVFDTTTVDDGPATITATAFSGDGASASSSVDVAIDNTKPVLSVSGPDRERFALGTNPRWTFSASDAGSGISHFRCAVRPIGETPTFGFCTDAASFVSSGLGEGTYTFSVRATDEAGNFAQQGRDFKIDAPAAVASSSPAPEPAAAAAVAFAEPARVAPVAIGTASPAPQVLVALGFRFASTRIATRLSSFVVKNVPAGATVTVLCPAGCAKTRFVKRLERGGRLLLKPVLKKRLRVGTEITMIVSKPGFTAAVKVLTIRARMAPLVTTLCQPEGSSKPAVC